MLKYISIFTSLVILLSCLFSNGEQIKIYENLTPNGDFEQASLYWTNVGSGGWSINDTLGINNSKCLFLDRNTGDPIVMVKSQQINLIPGRTYSFGGMIKALDVVGTGGSICLEWSSKETGQWVSGYYFERISGTQDWTQLRGEYRAPDYADNYSYSLHLYMDSGSYGKLYFDNIYLRDSAGNLLQNGDFQEAGAEWNNLNSTTVKVIANEGRNSTNGLVMSRSQTGSSLLAVSKKFELQPEKRYKFGGFIKTENLVGSGGGICLEWSNKSDNQWQGGIYIPDTNGTTDWIYINRYYNAPADADQYNYIITVYMRSDSYGKISFDDLYLVEENPLNLLQNGNFENQYVSWKSSNTTNWSIQEGCGRSATKALAIETVAPVSGIYVSSEKLYLQPGTIYAFGGYVKAENISGNGGNLSLEWFGRNTSQWLGGRYFSNLQGNSDWQYFHGTIKTPDDSLDNYYKFTLYLNSGTTGKLIFDDFYIYHDIPSWDVAMLYPSLGQTRSDSQYMEFTSFKNGSFDYNAPNTPDLKCRIKIFDENDNLISNSLVPIVNERIAFNHSPIPSGNKRILLELIDTANSNTVLSDKEIPILVKAANDPPSTVNIDSQGRLLVNNQIFVPVGTYLHDLSKSVIDNLAAAGFNCVLPYRSMYLNFNGIENAASIIEVMDYCESKGIKVIFSIKDLLPSPLTSWPVTTFWGMNDQNQILTTLVNLLKNHPALLAWYTSDETNVKYVDYLVERKRMINNLDPDHPVLNVFYQYEDFTKYAKSLDIFGIDPYPICNALSNNQKVVKDHLDSVNHAIQKINGGIAMLAVPQIFNPGIYDPVAKYDLYVYTTQFKYPSLHEMQSISILEAVFGAKGFVMYSYSDLFKGPDVDQYLNRWPLIQSLSSTLNDLKPFICSDIEGPEFSLNVIQGEVYAKSFQDSNGQVRLLIAGIGPGISKAEITFSNTQYNNLTSVLGKTTKDSNLDTYIFEGTDICSDILQN